MLWKTALPFYGDGGAQRGDGGEIRRAQFSPDGSCFFVWRNEGRIELYAFPLSPSLTTAPPYGVDLSSSSNVEGEDELNRSGHKASHDVGDDDDGNTGRSVIYPWVVCDAGGAWRPLWEVRWYSYFSCADPSLSCLATSATASPIHVRNCLDGSVRGSYRVTDHHCSEEPAHATSFAFAGCGGGWIAAATNKNALQVFDVQRPGLPIHSRVLSTRRDTAKVGGVRGILSTVESHPSEDGSCVGIGSYSGVVGVYDLRKGGGKGGSQPEVALPSRYKSLLRDDDGFEDDGRLRSGKETRVGGVTQLIWVNSDEVVVVSRADDRIRLWDIRQTEIPVFEMKRSHSTFQHLQASLIQSGEKTNQEDALLCTGDDRGDLKAFSLKTGKEMEGRDIGAENCSEEQVLPYCRSRTTENGRKAPLNVTGWSPHHPNFLLLSRNRRCTHPASLS